MNDSRHSAVGAWQGGWDEPAICAWAAELREQLGGQPVTFGLLFASPDFFGCAGDLLEVLRVHAHVPTLAGCSSTGLVAEGRELEKNGGFVLALYSIPGATARALPMAGAGDDPAACAERVGVDSRDVSSWLVFLEPFHTDAEDWMEAWQRVFPGIPVYGGLAAGRPSESRAQVYCNGSVLETGGVVLMLSGFRCLGAVAQGCTPIGETWTVTRAEGNVLHRIGNRPAVAVLEETYEGLDDEAKKRCRGNFFAGLAMSEYREDYRRGDFLVRSLIGADQKTGSVALAALPRTGQTLQFQLRDAVAADEDIREMLGVLRDEVGRSRVYGGCLCVCAGRGRGLFGEPDHDAGLVQKILGPSAVAGFFGNGEFGPVGRQSFVHGYTASLLLFLGPDRTEEDDL